MAAFAARRSAAAVSAAAATAGVAGVHIRDTDVRTVRVQRTARGDYIEISAADAYTGRERKSPAREMNAAF